jgi:hypothetical protein
VPRVLSVCVCTPRRASPPPLLVASRCCTLDLPAASHSLVLPATPFDSRACFVTCPVTTGRRVWPEKRVPLSAAGQAAHWLLESSSVRFLHQRLASLLVALSHPSHYIAAYRTARLLRAALSSSTTDLPSPRHLQGLPNRCSVTVEPAGTCSGRPSSRLANLGKCHCESEGPLLQRTV